VRRSGTKKQVLSAIPEDGPALVARLRELDDEGYEVDMALAEYLEEAQEDEELCNVMVAWLDSMDQQRGRGELSVSGLVATCPYPIELSQTWRTGYEEHGIGCDGVEVELEIEWSLCGGSCMANLEACANSLDEDEILRSLLSQLRDHVTREKEGVLNDIKEQYSGIRESIEYALDEDNAW